MAYKRVRKRYSVYETGTDRPLMIWGTAQECAAALGITYRSFSCYVSRARAGRPHKRCEIVVHDTSGEEDVLE